MKNRPSPQEAEAVRDLKAWLGLKLKDLALRMAPFYNAVDAFDRAQAGSSTGRSGPGTGAAARRAFEAGGRQMNRPALNSGILRPPPENPTAQGNKLRLV